jgi:hypothetical protein
MADEIHSEREASGPRDPFAPADGRVLGIEILSTAFLGGILLFGFAVTFPNPMTSVFVTFAASSLSLTAAWLALGNDPFALRFGVLGVPGVLLMLIPMIGVLFVYVTIIVLVLALPLFALRLLGFEFRARMNFEQLTGAPTARAQFSLTQLLIWSAIDSVIAFLARFIDFDPSAPESWRGLADIAIAATGLSMITLGTVSTMIWNCLDDDDAETWSARCRADVAACRAFGGDWMDRACGPER